MKTIVDTSVWSLAFRKRLLTDKEQTVVNKLIELMNSKELIIIGAVRQETLSGISDERRFEIIKNKLEPFPDFPVLTEDYITAARFFNICRAHGVQGSHIDFLISAVYDCVCGRMGGVLQRAIARGLSPLSMAAFPP